MALCGGGGGGGYTYTPIDDSAREAAQQAANRKRDEETAARNKFDYIMQALTTGGEGRQTGIDYFKSQGLAPDLSLIDRVVSDVAGRIPDLDANPRSYLTSDAFAGALDQAQTGKRNQFNRLVQGNFGPGFESRYLPDTTIDSIINDILDTQRTGAQTQLDYQKKRGVLTDTGYNTAEKRLGDQTTAARSTLSSLGTAALNKDRSLISDIAGQAGTAANNWNYGMGDFDITPFLSMASSKADSIRSGLKGDVLSALGGTQLFDIPSIIASAGTAQGPQNLVGAGVPFVEPKKQVKSRGLGSTGTF